MVKDRLTELKKRAEDNTKLINEKDVTVVNIDEDSLRNVFELAEQINGEIEKITGNVGLCRCYMKRIAESPFEEKDLNDKVTEIFEQNGKLTQMVGSKLKKFEKHVSKSNRTCTVGRIEIIQFSTLKTRFRKCILENNEEMENFKNYRISTYKAQLKAKGLDVTEEQFTEILEGNKQCQIFNDNVLIETAESKRLLVRAEALNEELMKIENLLVELRDLFQQMAVLIDEQQELIDVVEYQAQQAVEFVNKTPGILREAEDKKRKNLKMKFICYGLLIIILGFIVLSFTIN